MNKNYLLLAVLVMLMNSSCIDSKKHMIRKLYGKTINLTWITDYVGQSEEFIGNSDNSYLIVTKIEALTFTEHMVYFRSPYYRNMGTVGAMVYCLEELDDEMICKAYDPANGGLPLDVKGVSWQECFWPDEDLKSIPWQLV